MDKDKDQWQAVVNMVMNLRDTYKVENLTISVNIRAVIAQSV
jgi:hypothetical protein